MPLRHTVSEVSSSGSDLQVRAALKGKEEGVPMTGARAYLSYVAGVVKGS
jgi:hypothetical protein